MPLNIFSNFLFSALFLTWIDFVLNVISAVVLLSLSRVALPRNFRLRPCKIEKLKIVKLCHNKGLLKPFVERHVSVCLDTCFTFKVTFSFWWPVSG